MPARKIPYRVGLSVPSNKTHDGPEAPKIPEEYIAKVYWGNISIGFRPKMRWIWKITRGQSYTVYAEGGSRFRWRSVLKAKQAMKKLNNYAVFSSSQTDLDRRIKELEKACGINT